MRPKPKAPPSSLTQRSPHLLQHSFPPGGQNNFSPKRGVVIGHLLPNPCAGSGQQDAGTRKLLCLWEKTQHSTDHFHKAAFCSTEAVQHKQSPGPAAFPLYSALVSTASRSGGPSSVNMLRFWRGL